MLSKFNINIRQIYILLVVALFQLLLIQVPAGAEPVASVDLNPRLVRLGDTFTVDIRVISGEKDRIMSPAFPTPSGVSLGEQGTGQEISIRGGMVSHTITYYAVYSTQEAGTIDLGPFRISYIDENGDNQEIELDPVTVEIYEDAPRPPSSIIPGVSREWMTWLLVTIVLAALAGLIYAWMRLRKNKKPGPAPVATIRRSKSLEEAVLEEIKALQQPLASDRDAVKEYYQAVDRILRKYINQRYQVSTDDNTLWEIRQEFQNRQRLDSRVTGLFKIMNDCSWVKFAKTEPTQNDITDVPGRCSDSLTGIVRDD